MYKDSDKEKNIDRDCIDYLDRFKDKYLDKANIIKQRSIANDLRLKTLEHNQILSNIDRRYRDLLNNISPQDLNFSINSKDGSISLDSVDPNFKYKKEVFLFLKSISPWRKGPFRVLDTYIDAEWRSDIKWNRIEPVLGGVEEKRILDLGCNNGYFMFRLLEHNPSLVIGVDNFVKNLYCFNFFNYFIKNKVLFFELFSAENSKCYHDFFHTVLCLGLLYHLKDPISLLHSIHNSLVKDGKIIVECQGIDGEGSIALCPEGRYNGCSGIWYLPTKDCLISWLKRADFKNIDCFYDDYLTAEEQRSTEWAEVKSFSDFYDEKEEKTIEGYPRPRRIYLIAKK